ncbi:mCG146055, partial [Mus musculus]
KSLASKPRGRNHCLLCEIRFEPELRHYGSTMWSTPLSPVGDTCRPGAPSLNYLMLLH